MQNLYPSLVCLFHILIVSLENPLAEEPFFIEGELIWEKDTTEGFIYGMRFLSDSYSEEILLQTLKEYVKKNK